MMFKRTISILLCAAMFLSLSVSALANGEEIWIKDYYKDVFGDTTEDFYFTNKALFTGTYNSIDADDAPLGVSVIIDETDLYFMLFEDTTTKLKNREESSLQYSIAIKDAFGNKFSAEGIMQSGSDRLVVDSSDAPYIIDALCNGSGQVIIYIESVDQIFTNYLFGADCANLKELFREKQDAEALRMMESETQIRELLLYQKQNPDVIALLDIPGTNIHYPILQHPTEDNYYLNITLEGDYGYPGSIYTNLVEGKDFDTFNTVIYGYNMSDGSMFGTLNQYDNTDYMKKHREIHIYTPTEEHVYSVCAIVIYDDRYITYTYDDEIKEDRAAYLRSLQGGKWLDDIDVTPDSHIITLSTSIGGMPNNRRLLIAVENEVNEIELSNSIDPTDDFFLLCKMGDLEGAKTWLSMFDEEFPEREKWNKLLDQYLPYCGNWKYNKGDSSLLSSTIGQDSSAKQISTKVLISTDTVLLRLSFGDNQEYYFDLPGDFGENMFITSEVGDWYYMAALNYNNLVFMSYDVTWKNAKSCEYSPV